MVDSLKVVVTDHEYETLDRERQELARIGARVVAAEWRTEDELIAQTADADGLLVQYAAINRRVIENLRKCRAIVRYGIGIDCVDVQAATDHGIMVANVPDYGLQDVADHTVALLLAAARKIVPLNRAVKSGIWDYKLAKPVHRLEGKVLGLVAFGSIARMVAERLRPFGIKVQVYDPFVSPELVTEQGAISVDLEPLFASSDFISLHAPLLPSTRHLVGARLLTRVKPNAILINTARGGLIDEEALIDALQSGRLGGAALDVTAIEPINPDNPLLQMDNVIITPHSAWYTEEAQDSLQYKVARDMVRALSGQIPINILNPECLKQTP